MSLRAFIDKLALPEFGTDLRLFHASSAQRKVRESIDACLVLYEDVLINPASGEQRALQTLVGEQAEEEDRSWAQRVAAAARKLLPRDDPAPSVLLLLPSSSFIATRFSLGISGERLIKSALRLQVPTVLPAYEAPLLLAVNAQKPEGIALWYPQADTDALFNAFAAEGLHLAALMPRALALAAAGDGSGVVLDQDARHLTLVELNQGQLRSCLSICRSDLENAAFRQQWEAELAGVSSEGGMIEMDQRYWQELRKRPGPLDAYCFYPQGAIQAGKRLLARKQKRVGAIAAAALVVIMTLPFISNWLRIAWLEGQVDDLRDLSAEARASQAAVYDMEDAWGPVAEYPRQDVAQVLLTLNQFIEGSLSNFSIERGVIEITGYSQDPALLIEQLAETELFHDVGQSRSSSIGGNSGLGDRFGIRMSLSGVDFPAYEARYPATRQ